MTGYHQPAQPRWTLSLILLKQKKKQKQKNRGPAQNTDYKKRSSQPPLLLSNFTHSNPSYAFHLLQKNMLLISVCLCLPEMWTALSLCFYIPTPFILASVWETISQLCWRSINPDRSIVPTLFTGSDQRLALRYHFQLEKHSWAEMGMGIKIAAAANRKHSRVLI